MVRWGAVIVLLGCGSRTTLDLEGPAQPHDSGLPDTSPPSHRSCQSASECDDGIACTFDVCEQSVCAHIPNDGPCGGGTFCGGMPRCDVVKGCVTTMPGCDDGIACTTDTCDETKKACTHDPDDSKCPISHACDPKNGCEQRSFAHSDTMLYDIRLPSGVVKPIGMTGAHLTDIALHPNNTLYGFSYATLWTVDQATGKATFVQTLADSINAADVDPNGTMYVAGTSSLYTMNVKTGALTFIASFPGGAISSGDLAFVGKRLFATAHNSGGFGNDDLVEFDLPNNTAKVVGTIGAGCVWALAAYTQTLFGMNCMGSVLTIDLTTAKGTGVGPGASVVFWGATAR